MTSDGRASAIPRSTVVAVVTATTIAQVASVMGFAIFPVIAPRLAHEIGVPASMVGYQLSIGYGTAMLATSYVSSTIPRFGACRSTQVGLLLSALGMLCAMTASVAAVIIASVLLGLGMSVMTPASTHLLFRFGPAHNRNLIFSIKQTAVPAGLLLAAAAWLLWAGPADDGWYFWSSRQDLLSAALFALGISVLLWGVQTLWWHRWAIPQLWIPK